MFLNIKDYEVLIDDEDFERVSQYKWRPMENKRALVENRVYFQTHSYKDGKIIYLLLHRFLMGVSPGIKKVVDHKDLNTLNCQKENLRICSYNQNNMNQRIRKNNTSGYKGVSWSKRDKKWEAYINLNKKKIHLGLYFSPELAYEAYCVASLKYHNDFGRIS